MYKIENRPEWGRLATFVPNKTEAVYNWFFYKEGFSKELVVNILKLFGVGEGQTVLDPFCGVGTALLACRQSGIDSVGFDVHPVSVFASRVKVGDYDPKGIKETVKALLKERFQKRPRPEDPLLRRAFKKQTLEDVVFFRDLVMRVKDTRIRDFLLLALMNVAIKCSYVFKDGTVIKFRKKPVPPLRSMFRRQVFRMIKDIRRFPVKECETRVEFGDARRLKLPDSSVDYVITSPPYLNKIEYTKIYEIEQKLFLDFVQERPPIRSYVGLSEKYLERESLELSQGLEEKTIRGLPGEAVPYFIDMNQSISELYRVCRPGARLAIVVGNGCFPTGVVDSDILLSRMGEKAGFKARKILVLNERWCTKNRVEKVGRVRESLLLWEK
jgi:DNA modification methylase